MDGGEEGIQFGRGFWKSKNWYRVKYISQEGKKITDGDIYRWLLFLSFFPSLDNDREKGKKNEMKRRRM